MLCALDIRLVRKRTALPSQLRAVLLRRGIAVAKGRRQLELRPAEILDDEGKPPATWSPVFGS